MPTPMKRKAEAVFGEPDPLLDKCKKAFRHAEDIVDEAMPEQMFMQVMDTPETDRPNRVGITILCAVKLAKEESEEDVISVAHRYWNDESDRDERNALRRFREKSNSTPAIDIVHTFLAGTALKPTANQSIKNEPVLTPTQPVRGHSNEHQPIVLSDNSDAATDEDQLLKPKTACHESLNLEPTAKQSTKNEVVPKPNESVRGRRNEYELHVWDDDSDASADQDQPLKSKNERHQPLNQPTTKKSAKNEPAPTPTESVRGRSNEHEPIDLDDDSDARSNSASAYDDQLHHDYWIYFMSGLCLSCFLSAARYSHCIQCRGQGFAERYMRGSSISVYERVWKRSSLGIDDEIRI